MDSYPTKRVLGLGPEPRADETPAQHLNDGGFVKCRDNATTLQGLSFQSLYFVFRFGEHFEDSEDTHPTVMSDTINEPRVG
jgi:hypothetical protein